MTGTRVSRPLRLLAVLVAAAMAVVLVIVVVKYADGAFSGQYSLKGTFPQSGEGLHAGSEVVYRGVQVGRVTSIALVDRRARVGMAINPSFKVPTDAQAVIGPINVFGADEVELDFPSGDRTPTLRAGGSLIRTATSPELGDLFAAATPLLEQIDAPDLSSVVNDLAQASQGEGPTIRQSLDEGARLAALLDQTLPAQLTALDSFSGFVDAIEPTASSFNAIAQASNVALPAFNAAAAAYAKLLRTLAPFAQNLAEFLAAYHPDIETILDSGDNVARVVLAQQSQIGQVIQGLGSYAEVFAKALDPAEVLPDGSHFGYFQTFVTFDDINQLVCSLIAPAVPGLSSLEPLQQALTGSGTLFDCSSQIAAFDSAQSSGTNASSAAPSTPAPTVSTPSSSTSSVGKAAQQLSTGLYQALGSPQSAPKSSSVGSIVSSVLGGLR
jgi:phospholipid/cholesterol/gamma-HCH transport system substrate-binding protein